MSFLLDWENRADGLAANPVFVDAHAWYLVVWLTAENSWLLKEGGLA